jgi:predicted ATP-grasp superfamily ATP-dependent carboligase
MASNIYHKKLGNLLESNNPIAAILGLGTNGLGIIRSLSKEGIKTIGFYNDDEKEIGRFSKYCISIRCPHISEEENLLQFLIEFGNKLKTKAVLFAESDDYVLFISKNEKLLHQYFLFNLPERNVLVKIINKKEFYKICEELDILYPKTYYFDTYEELSISNDIKYPCIVKPIFTKLFVDKFNKKILLVNSKKELLETCSSLVFKEIMIQEIISGKDDSIYFCGAYFGLDYQPKGVSLGRKIRQSSRFGVTSLAESISDEFLLNLSITTLQKLKFRGLCDMEFKKDPEDNKYKIIEINARTGLWHALCTISGVNLCAIAFYDLTGMKYNVISYNQKTLRWINELGDLLLSFRLFKTGELSFKSWITSLKGVRSFAIFKINDPMPFLFLFLNIMKRFMIKSCFFWREKGQDYRNIF